MMCVRRIERASPGVRACRRDSFDMGLIQRLTGEGEVTAGCVVKKGLPVVTVTVRVRNVPRPPHLRLPRWLHCPLRTAFPRAVGPLLDLSHPVLEGRAVSDFPKLPSSP